MQFLDSGHLTTIFKGNSMFLYADGPFLYARGWTSFLNAAVLSMLAVLILRLGGSFIMRTVLFFNPRGHFFQEIHCFYACDFVFATGISDAWVLV